MFAFILMFLNIYTNCLKTIYLMHKFEIKTFITSVASVRK